MVFKHTEFVTVMSKIPNTHHCTSRSTTAEKSLHSKLSLCSGLSNKHVLDSILGHTDRHGCFMCLCSRLSNKRVLNSVLGHTDRHGRFMRASNINQVDPSHYAIGE
jgi:hypothetical protein